MQNPLFGSKTKIKKTCQNPFYKSFPLIVSKKQLEKTPNIREMKAFSKAVIIKGYSPCINPHFGSKIKIAKDMSKSILKIILSCYVQKNAQKKPQIFEK